MQQLAPSRRYHDTLWRDTNILAGEGWHGEIQRALNECQLGLLLISPAFLSSTYIAEHELPHFIGDAATPVLPVMLQPVDFQRHDLKGLAQHQIFRLNQTEAFDNCTTSTTRRRYAEQLFDQIERRLDRLFTTD